MTGRSVRSRRRGAVLAAATVIGLAGCSGSASTPHDPPTSGNPGGVVISGVQKGPYQGAALGAPEAMPNVTLTASTGQPYDLATNTTSPVTMVYFGYTNCQDVCQLVMADITSAYLRLPSDTRAKTQVLFVTTDPARDTVRVLQRYLSRFDPHFVGLTGSLGDIRRAATALGVPLGGTHRLPSGGYEVDHGTQVLGFKGTHALVAWTQGTPVGDMVDDIETLAS